MKFSFNLSAVLCALWLAASNNIIIINNNNNGVAQAQTINELIVASQDFSMLEAVVTAVPGAADFLQVNEATLFAPTNAAFDAADQDLINELLTPAFSLHLQNLLHYHVIPNVTILEEDIMDGSQVQTLVPDTLLVLFKAMDGSISVNGMSNIIQADFNADNGVVHVVDRVLLPSWVSFSSYELASFLDEHSTLVELIDYTMLNGTLNGTGPFTVFAPTNDAFAAALAANPELNTSDIDLVSTILRGHIVADVVTSDNILNGAAPTTLSGETLTFIVGPEGIITVNGATISGFDLLTNNGVIHILDDVIIPVPSLPTIAEIVIADDDFSSLEDLLVAFEEAANFLQVNTATVFAPTNAAFAALDQGFFNNIIENEAFGRHLSELLAYHIIPGRTVMIADIMDGDQLGTIGVGSLTFAKTMNGTVTIDGYADVIQADVPADNGVVHIVDAVLFPSWAYFTAYEFAAVFPNTSTLVSFVDSAMLNGTLNGSGPVTVFAPLDDAFAATLAANPDIDENDMDAVGTILRMHIVADVILIDEITDGTEVTALSGDTLTFNVMDDGSKTVNGIAIAIVDNLVTNGVVHILDGIILPIPAATTAPIATATAAPIAMTAAPIAMTAAPIATTSAPVVIATAAPVAMTAAPIATTTAPIATTTVPIAIATTTAPIAAPVAAPNSSASGLTGFAVTAGVMASHVAAMLS